MAMACAALSSGLSSVTLAPSSTSKAPTRRCSISSCSFLSGRRLTSIEVCPPKRIERPSVIIKATAAEGADPEVPVVEEPGASVDAPLNPIAALKLQSELLKKKAKKLELRRKRLVRKRHLRKKGRWPPSKMKKNKNV